MYVHKIECHSQIREMAPHFIAVLVDVTVSPESSTTAGAGPTFSTETTAGKSSKGLMGRVKEGVEQLGLGSKNE